MRARTAIEVLAVLGCACQTSPIEMLGLACDSDNEFLVGVCDGGICVDTAGGDSSNTGDPRGDPTVAGDSRGDPIIAGDSRGDPTVAGDSRGDPIIAGDGRGDPIIAGDGRGDPIVAGDSRGDPTVAGDSRGDPTVAGDSRGDPTIQGDAGGDYCVGRCDCGAELVACFPFDGNTNDSSGYANHATATNVSYETGQLGQAVRIVPGSTSIQVADSASLDPSAQMTIEAWVFADSFPVGARSGIIDKPGQYSMWIYGNGSLRCSAAGAFNTAADLLDTGVWMHLACSFDGVTLRAYRDGNELTSALASPPIPTASTSNMSIGHNLPVINDHLDGLLDHLRIWNRGRTATEICKTAGGC